MVPKIVFCGYREWALEIYNFISHKYKNQLNIILVKDPLEFDKLDLETINPTAIFFIGWSWIVKQNVVDKWTCICLHPSTLPKYRGGSPIQHQIINGETKSAVTYFKMDKGIDAGDIIWQKEFSLEGDLKDILCRISELGKEGVSYMLNTILNKKDLKMMPQDNIKSTIYKRRTPAESEIKIEDFKKYTAKEIYNKIRALQDPYPNAYVICKDNTKLYIKKAEIKESKNG